VENNREWQSKPRRVPLRTEAEYILQKPDCPLDKFQKQTRLTWDYASNDPDQINKWLAENFNLAVMLGEVPEISQTYYLGVIDVDSQRAQDALHRIEKEVGLYFPTTYKVLTSIDPETGFQKYQLYYLIPNDIVLKSEPAVGGIEGLDYKSHGSYVVGAGSKISGHQYEAANDSSPSKLLKPLAQALAALQQGQTTTPTNGSAKIEEGRRNAELTRRAGFLRAAGSSYEEINAALQGINRRDCTKPLPENEVSRIAKSVARYEPSEAKEKTKPQRKLFLVTSKSMKAIADEVKLWLWLNVILSGEVNLIIGDSDVGKTIFTVLVIACVTSGKVFPLGSPNKFPPKKVFIYCREDSYNALWKPRLTVAGADLDLVIPIHGIGTSSDDPEPIPLCLDQAEHLAAVQQQITAEKDVALVVFDPLSEMSGKCDIYRPDVRTITTGLTKLARMAGVAIILIHHTNKRPSERAAHAAAGNAQLMAAVPNAWLFAINPDVTKQFLMMQARNKYGKKRSFKYQIVGRPWPAGFKPDLDPGEQDDGCGLMEFIGKANVDANEFLQRNQEEGASATSRAKRWLNEMLANGPVRALKR
jgi:hypothetical protein